MTLVKRGSRFLNNAMFQKKKISYKKLLGKTRN